MKTKPWGNLTKVKILVIGHDPRLRQSDTVAGYSFFSDYFFKPIPTKPSELSKYKLAEQLFSYIMNLCNFRYTIEQIYVTNLCNTPLPHAPKGKTVFIPQNEAINGLNSIKKILNSADIEILFPMSQQVNYWLQKLCFYQSSSNFLNLSEPKLKGINNMPPYYEPSKPSAFKLICGKQFKFKNNLILFPILHVKNWPLRGRFKETYESCYRGCINQIKKLIIS